jgi:hypothetical protein
VLLIQILAATLLLLGSGLIFRALVEIDRPARPRPLAHRWPPLASPALDVEDRDSLPRAA